MSARPIAEIATELRAKMEGVTLGPHDWGPSRVGHGVQQCQKCFMTYMEATVLGQTCHLAEAVVTCDPDTIRAVLDDNDDLRAQLAAVTKERNEARATVWELERMISPRSALER